MKAFTAIKLLTTLLAAATAADSVRGVRQLRQVTNFRQIKLAARNMLPDSNGVPFAIGIASVQLNYDQYRTPQRKVCIQTNVMGFCPRSLHIKKGTIKQNGMDEVDFSGSLKKGDPIFSGCVGVSSAVFNDIKSHPESYYVDAGVSDSPADLAKLGIRGQLVQGYKTSMNTKEQVGTNEPDFVGSGVAKLWFEEAGKTICIDAMVSGFTADVAHIHRGDFGKNGVQIAVLSKTTKADGTCFLGCGSLSDLGVDASQRATLAADFLEYPSHYYIQFHAGKAGTPGFRNAIRGQFEKV